MKKNVRVVGTWLVVGTVFLKLKTYISIRRAFR